MSATSRQHRVTLFLSSGRCGTQWLASALRRHHGHLAEVRHEPLLYRYCPRAWLRSGADLDEHPNGGEVRAHLARIERLLDERSYVEVGWPAFVAVPLFRRVFGERLQVVHLTRHPVYSACSMTTHDYYRETRQDGFARDAFLQPLDPGVRLASYADRWASMSPYEKCLFLWAEIHGYALELRRDLGVRWLHVKMEDLFDPRSGALARLLDFLGLPASEALTADRDTVHDLHRARTAHEIPWREIESHPEVLRLTDELGYSLDEVSARRIRERYLKERTPGRQDRSIRPRTR